MLPCIPVYLKLIKKDLDNNYLGGATFYLYNYDDTKADFKGSVDGHGTSQSGTGELTITGLAVGKYILEETTAPSGFVSS